MPTVVDLSALGSRGFTIQGDAPFDGAGWSVADAGDVNGDGFDDLIVGAPFNDGGGSDAGRAYVIFGGPGGFDTIDLGNLQAADGFLIQGNDGYDLAGFAVAGAGDINGDGFDDVIVGAVDGYNFYYGGRSTAYVIFGSASPDPINLTFLSPSDGFRIIGNFSYYSTILSVSGAGDINGDGFEDIIIGSTNDNNYAGAAYVIFGKASGFGNIDLANLAPSAGFRITGDAQGDSAGRSVSAAGDVNGDGFDDLIVGAPLGDDGGNAAGEAYVVFGKASGLRRTIEPDQPCSLPQASSSRAMRPATGPASACPRPATSTATASTTSSSARRTATTAARTPARPMWCSAEHPASALIDLYQPRRRHGFIIQGDAAGDEAGCSVSAAGDVNGDGFDDLIVGAPFGDDGGYRCRRGLCGVRQGERRLRPSTWPILPRPTASSSRAIVRRTSRAGSFRPRATSMATASPTSSSARVGATAGATEPARPMSFSARRRWLLMFRTTSTAMAAATYCGDTTMGG